jgi:phosphoglycerol transferase MdoB-like AlkP superfamily enzyme
MTFIKNLFSRSLSLINSNVLMLFILFCSLSRIILFCFALYEQQIDFNLFDFLQVMLLGLLSDFIAAFYFLAPLVLVSLTFPKTKGKIAKAIIKCLYFLLIALLCFFIVAEFTFWLEFSTKFNFIAVDYLVYTHEVIGNIVQSYPVFWIFSLLLLTSAIIYYKFSPRISLEFKNILSYKEKFIIILIFSSFAVLSFSFYNPRITDLKDNNYLSELSKNGLYNLFSAFRNNSIDYFSFYSSKNDQEALDELASYITLKDQTLENSALLERHIKPNAPKKDYNIILVTIESMSSEFLTTNIHNKPITPVINELIKESLYFDHFYATGTRTIRGLESITLSVPPIPGQSIVRRPNNQNLFSIATILNKENYDLKFIYGGYGYFDNMNRFFTKNNFKVIDRNDLTADDIEFENIWGVSDEDLYKQVIKQADASYAKQQKFFSFVMTTSNHRPYTYPDNKVDIPSKTSRHGGVKYTDYALGQLIKIAKTKPWFDNTIFIITADHCAGSAGKVALPPDKYRIPLLIYAPKLIKPGVISKISSQIDIAPTIMGMLNLEYNSRFFGNDMLQKTYQNAFISTFQKLGYIENNKLVVLSPGKIENTYKIFDNDQIEETSSDPKIVNRAINYYQSAYSLFQKGLLKQDAKTNK